MVQPIDYANLAGGFQSPQDAFLRSVALQRAEQERRAAMRQKQEAETQAVAMKAEMEDYMSNPTPQKLANLHLRYPALKESLNAYTQTLTDADKKTTTEFASQAFSLNRANKPEQVVALFDRYIEGAKNSNRPDMVRVLTDAKGVFQQTDDPNVREGLIASVLAGTGKEGLDLYKSLYSSNLDLDTSLIKNVVALGFKPGTPEFQSELRKQMDKVTITRPDGTFIQGTPDEIRSILQGGGKVLPRVATQEEASRLPPGTEFIGPDGKVYRVPGGQTGSAPSGSFPQR